jgi:hypothetical protein
MQQVRVMAPDCATFITVNDGLVYRELRVNYGSVQMVRRSVLCKRCSFRKLFSVELRNETLVTETFFVVSFTFIPGCLSTLLLPPVCHFHSICYSLHLFFLFLFYLCSFRIFLFSCFHHYHHQLGLNRPISASSDIPFKGLPSRLRPFGL